MFFFYIRLKNGYWSRFCNFDQSNNVCPDLTTSISAADIPSSIHKANYASYYQNVYRTSIAKYLHVDLTFRTINERYTSAVTCAFDEQASSTNTSSVRFQEYILRFYRIC